MDNKPIAGPRGVFRRWAHRWQTEGGGSEEKLAAPVPRGVRHTARVVAPPVRGLEVLGEELKVARLRGLPTEHHSQGAFWVGLWSGLQQDRAANERVAAEGVTLQSRFEARFRGGLLTAHFAFLKSKELARRGLPPPSAWFIGDLLTPLSLAFSTRFPEGCLRAEGEAKSRAKEQREERWGNPLRVSYPPPCGWVTGGGAGGLQAGFATRFPAGLGGCNGFIARKQLDSSFWAGVPSASPPSGVHQTYQRTAALLEEGGLSAYFDTLLAALGEKPTTTTTTTTVGCPHHQGMMCVCGGESPIGPQSPSSSEVLCLFEGAVVPVSACFAVRFSKGLRSVQAKARREGAALRIQGLVRMRAAQTELRRLKDFEAFFAAQRE